MARTASKAARAIARNPYLWRNATALAALAALALPWISLDSQNGASSAAELIAQALTGPERGLMLSQSPAGAASLLATPFISLALCILAWKAELQHKPSAAASAAITLLPIPMLILAQGLASQDSRIMGITAAPQAGLLITMLAHSILAAHRLAGDQVITIRIRRTPSLRQLWPAGIRIKMPRRRQGGTAGP